MSKWIIWTVVIIVVIAGVWYVMTRPASPAQAPADTSTAATSNSEGTASSDTSDAQLQADLNASDSQMQSASDASASANSFNDTPVTQTE